MRKQNNEIEGLPPPRLKTKGEMIGTLQQCPCEICDAEIEKLLKISDAEFQKRQMAYLKQYYGNEKQS